MTDDESDTPPLRGRRCVLAMSSGGTGIMLNGATPMPPLKPDESARLTARPFPTHLPFRAERMLVNGAGRHDWLITDLLVDGVQQFEKPIATKDFDEIAPYPLQELTPGGLKPKSTALVVSLNGLAPCTKEMVMVVTYVGSNPEGEHFECAIIGDVPQPLDTV